MLLAYAVPVTRGCCHGSRVAAPAAAAHGSHCQALTEVRVPSAGVRAEGGGVGACGRGGGEGEEEGEGGGRGVWEGDWRGVLYDPAIHCRSSHVSNSSCWHIVHDVRGCDFS